MPHNSRPDDSVSYVANNLVTPSPLSSFKSKNELSVKIPRKKRLFSKKGSSVRKHLATTTTNETENFSWSSSTSKFAHSYSPKELFPSSPDINNVVAIGTKNDISLTIRKGKVGNKKPTTGTSGIVSTGRKFRENGRRNLLIRDSLGALASITKTTHVTKNIVPKIINEKKSFQKQPQHHAVVNTTMWPSLNKKNDKLSARKYYPSNAEKNYDSKKKISCRIGDGKNDDTKKRTKKNKNSVPIEYIALLASRATFSVQRKRARSTLEILNDISEKKELELKNARIASAFRARLPRACKNSRKASLQESVTDDDIDEELEAKLEEDEDKNQCTKNKDTFLIGEKHKDRRNDNVTATLFSTGISSVSTNNFLAKNKIKTISLPSSFSDSSLGRDLLSTASKNPVEFSCIEDDNCKKRVHEPAPKKRLGNSFQHQEVDILSTKTTRSRKITTINEGATQNLAEISVGNSSGDSALRTTNERKENNSQEIEQQKDALRRKRHLSIEQKSRELRDNNKYQPDIANNTSSSSSGRTNNKLLLIRNQQRQLVQPNRLSSRRRAQRQRQFSAEEYSIYSNYSSNGKLEQQDKVATGMNPCQAFVTVREGHSDDATSALNMASNNLIIPCRSHNYSTLSGDERPNFYVSDTCTKNYENSTLQRRNQQQPRSPRQLGKKGKSLKKRVRFDSSTTTFSVKIKIKTNHDAGRNNKHVRNLKDSVTLSPSLDELAAQAIANQVTQAYLTQAATSSTVSACRVPKVDINIKRSDGEEVSSPSSDVSSKSIESSDKNVSIHNNRGNLFPLREGNDDGRSITSELTNDWNNKPSKFREQEDKIRKVTKNVPLCNKDGSAGYSSVPQKNNEGYHGQDCGNVNLNETFQFAKDEESEIDYHDTDPATAKLQINGEKRSRLSIGRRQRMWHSSDSLAGYCADWSKTSVVAGSVSMKIPREVTMQNPILRSEGRYHSKIGFIKSKQPSATATASRAEKNVEINGYTRKGMGKNAAVVPISPDVNNESRLVPMSPTYRCGKCKGCRRTLDCQTCVTCLENLHCYESPPSPSTKDISVVCLLRRCQRTYRVGRVDSLLGLISLTKFIQPKHHKNGKKEQKKEHSLKESTSAKHLAGNSMNEDKETKGSSSKNIKGPWDDGDDWTVDYSYLSNPRHRSKVTNYRVNKKFPRYKIGNYKAGLGIGGRSSFSSVSESVISQKISTLPAAIAVSGSKRGRRRGVKRKKDQLHGLALPSTSTDVCSVTSWRENRKCLRALMQYDEADQDWV